MTDCPVSVIVVSRDRPRLLRRCLTGLSQLDYPAFEVVVVADPDGCEELRAMRMDKKIKLIPYDVANIAEARNLGLHAAAGKVVAFIDDDAVPEPTWLTHLVAPLASGQAVAAGGYVRGRNGISFQWTARDVRPNGWSEPLDIESDKPVLVAGDGVSGVKTEGTNMAFDRAYLCAIGGFDPVFHFYLDETDVNMRLARLMAVTAIVPLAQVHHGFAASDRRRADRAPVSLFDLGRSLKIYLRKYLDPARHDQFIAMELDSQRKRVLTHMVAGRIDPLAVSALLGTFMQGVAEGETARIAELAPIGPANQPFKRFPSDFISARHVVLVERWYSQKRISARAAKEVEAGNRVSVFRYSLTGLFHRVTFTSGGFWLQRGGLFGRSDRRDPLWKIRSKKARTAYEMGRLHNIRQISAGGAD